MVIAPSPTPLAPLTRRQLLAGIGASLIAVPTASATSEDFRVLRARPGEVRLRGSSEAPTSIWGYEGGVPGPFLASSKARN